LPQKLKGKIALVTGASRGIGAAIAERFAAEGAFVVVAARSLDTAQDNAPGTLNEVIAAIKARGGAGLAVEVDMASADSRQHLVDRVIDEAGDIDILVNNAAAAAFLPFTKFSERHLDIATELNFRGPWQLCSGFIPGMQRKGQGWILNITTYAADMPGGTPPYDLFHQHGGFALYGATKAALNRMTVALAAEFYANNIVANALAPLEMVITPGVREAGMDKHTEGIIVEPVEAMAEAALALCTSGVDGLNGKIFKSLPLLKAIEQPIHTLDGRDIVTFDYVERTAPYAPKS
jgi:citronellol/citronellal dehydrogenase